LKRYAVENVGYCLVARRSQGVHICLRPEVIAQPTLAAAMYWLIEQRALRVVISILRQTWTHRLLTSDASAVSLLSAEAMRGSWPGEMIFYVAVDRSTICRVFILWRT
jgi:hypothetical protein